MSTLYQITNEYLELLDLADKDDQAFLDTLESITGELQDKAESYAVVISEINAGIEKFNKTFRTITSAWSMRMIWTRSGLSLKEAIVFRSQSLASVANT